MTGIQRIVLVGTLMVCGGIASAGSFKKFKVKDSGPQLWMEQGVNQIANAAFDNSGKGWGLYFSGGSAAVSYGKNKVRLTVRSTGNVNYGVQFYYDGFRLYRGGKYTFSFTASSSSPKGCEVRLQMNGGDYHAYVMDTYTFTEQPQTFTLHLNMDEDSDVAPRLAFNMGSFPDRDKEIPADVTITDVSLVLENSIVTKEKGNGGADFVRVNQIGYRPQDKKIAFVKVTKDRLPFTVRDSAGTVVYTGKLAKAVREERAYEYTAAADFSAVTQPGTYTVEAEGNSSFPFRIGDDVYDKLTEGTLKFFTLQRCGENVDDPVFGHPACHTGKARIIGTNDYTTITGGWHDAGDYGRYVVAGAKAAADLLLAWQASGGAYTQFDILNEARYELDWMLAMQRSDGGVYHKLTTKKFPPYEMPEQETEPLFVSPVSTTATGDFAAVMALASECYREKDPQFADRARAAAEQAWAFLKTNDAIAFKNSPGMESGEYGDIFDADERYFAAAALFEATGTQEYADAAAELKKSGVARTWRNDYGWASVEAYGDELIIRNAGKMTDQTAVAAAKKSLLARADEDVAAAKKSGFRVALTDFIWGSNMNVLDTAHRLLVAYDVTGKAAYRDTAISQIDYILGCNPMSECYVTGFGSHSPAHPHHRPSITRDTPMPGMVVGGPDEHLEDAFAQNLLADKPPLLCYLDHYQSFSTNEVTIYWNSPLVYCLIRVYYSK